MNKIDDNEIFEVGNENWRSWIENLFKSSCEACKNGMSDQYFKAFLAVLSGNWYILEFVS